MQSTTRTAQEQEIVDKILQEVKVLQDLQQRVETHKEEVKQELETKKALFDWEPWHYLACQR